MAGHDWYDDPVSAPYHDDLDIAAANSQAAAISSGHPENAMTSRQIANQIGIESGYDTGAVSSTGAVGIAQILPSTAKNPGYGIASVDPTDTSAAIQFMGTYDGTRGVSGYSGGQYNMDDVNSGALHVTANGNTAASGQVAGSTLTQAQQDAINAAGSDTSTEGVVLNSDGSASSIADGSIDTGDGSDYGAIGKALASATGSKNGGGLTGIVAAGEEVFTRVVVVAIGLLLIFGGLIMFRPVQNAIKTVKP